MARKVFTEHPMFPTVSRAVNATLEGMAGAFGVRDELDSPEFETAANRLADDAARLLLRLMDAKARRGQRGEIFAALQRRKD